MRLRRERDDPTRRRDRALAARYENLAGLSREARIDEVHKLRAAIRIHRDSTGHELCWHHPASSALLPEKTDPKRVVPDWPQFMRGCIHHRQSLDDQLADAPRSDAEFRS